jgi:hypothetical protein
LDRLKAQLNSRGATTIRGLARSFKALDSYDGNRKIDPNEFFIGLQENGVKLTKQESDVDASFHIPYYFIYRHSCYTSTLIEMAQSTSMSSLLASG